MDFSEMYINLYNMFNTTDLAKFGIYIAYPTAVGYYMICKFKKWVYRLEKVAVNIKIDQSPKAEDNKSCDKKTEKINKSDLLLDIEALPIESAFNNKISNVCFALKSLEGFKEKKFYNPVYASKYKTACTVALSLIHDAIIDKSCENIHGTKIDSDLDDLNVTHEKIQKLIKFADNFLSFYSKNYSSIIDSKDNEKLTAIAKDMMNFKIECTDKFNEAISFYKNEACNLVNKRDYNWSAIEPLVDDQKKSPLIVGSNSPQVSYKCLNRK